MSEAPILPFVPTLRRFLAPAVRPHLRCELCGDRVPDAHGHVVDLESRRLLCACDPCGSSRGRYRPVPSRYIQLPPSVIAAEAWDALDIPVGLAWFFHNSSLSRVVAFYPGPAGAVESALPARSAVVDRIPAVGMLEPDVEALLVRRRDAGCQAFVVPIDACYELVGRIRTAWKGLGGDPAVREDIDRLFAGIAERCAARGAGPGGTTGGRGHG